MSFLVLTNINLVCLGGRQLIQKLFRLLYFFFFCLGNVTISNVRILRASLTSPTSRPLHSITTASRILKESQLPSMLMLFIWVERPGFLFFHGPGSHYLA